MFKAIGWACPLILSAKMRGDTRKLDESRETVTYENNPYYKPALYKCRTVGKVDIACEMWTFDIIAVLQHEDGGYYIGTDNGCSCPTPFEYYDSLDDFTGPLAAGVCAEEVVSLWCRNDSPVGAYEVCKLVKDILGLGENDSLPRGLQKRIRGHLEKYGEHCVRLNKDRPNERRCFQLTCDECGAVSLLDSSDTASDDCDWQTTPEHDYCPKHWRVKCVLCRREYHGAYAGLSDWKLSNMPDCLCPRCLRELAIADLAEKEHRNW